MLTLEQVAKALPPNLKKAATQSLVDQLNNIASDPDLAEAIRDNFLSYTKVLSEGRFKVKDYLNAVKFVSYRLMGYCNQDAYFRTFPHRHQALVAKGAQPKDIAAYVAMYSKGKLVNAIMEQALVPTWVLNQDLYQEAINVQASLMLNAKSEMVRMQAANSLLQHLKRPEAAATAQVNIDLRQTSGMDELKATLRELAQQQQALIRDSGVSPKLIADQAIVEVEPE